MTKEELSRLYDLKKLEQKLREKLADTRLEAQSIPGSRLDGMPRGPRNNTSRVEMLAVKAAELEGAIKEKQVEAIHIEAEMRKAIGDVPDCKTRLILLYRFVYLLSWEDVAQKLGVKETAGGVRKDCERYLKAIATAVPKPIEDNAS